jgi:glycosyltransferase involved in cell wall biosynthesis
MSLYIDLSELLKNPIKTGIQRIAGEMCRYLPPGAVIPVRLRSDYFVAYSSALMESIGRYFRGAAGTSTEELQCLGAVENGVRIEVSNDDTVLVPEVLIEPHRLEFFRKMPAHEFQRYKFIIYDLLPVTNPEYFRSTWLLEICEYYRILRRATSCGFISEETREAYYGRLMRTNARGGVVLPLGCDSLGTRADRPLLNRPLAFSVLGTIEPRKNHKLILEAFEPLLGRISGLSLTFIGKMGWVDSEFADRVQRLTSDKNSGFRFESVATDDAIRRCIEKSRATVYLSAAEGYGLPPVESLWVGTPVIASRTIPSLKRLGSAGIHYVEPLNAVNLRRAILAFVDDVYANRKAEETVQLNLPTWQSFTEEVLRWCREN